MRHQVPQVADLGLADAVDATKSLLQPVRVPGQVIVDHQVGPLQVDAFPGGVGRHQHQRILVLREQFLNAFAFFAAHAAADRHNSLVASDQGSNAADQIIERVAVFCEQNQLATHAGGVKHGAVILQQAG